MARMKMVAAVILLALTSCLFHVQRAYSQTPEPKPQCSPLFKVNWSQFGGETVDAVTVCTDGKVLASHTFTAPAFGNTPADRTTWRYSGHIDNYFLSDLRKILRRSDISKLPARVDLAINGVPASAIHEKEDTAQFSISREGGEQDVVVRNIPAIFCRERPARVEDAVWDLICLYGDLYTRAKSGKDSSTGECGCKSVKEMVVSQLGG